MPKPQDPPAVIDYDPPTEIIGEGCFDASVSDVVNANFMELHWRLHALENPSPPATQGAPPIGTPVAAPKGK